MSRDVSINETSDACLVQQCLQGNQQSFAQLYRRYQQKVRSTLYQLCGQTALDDLVQEVFLRAWKGLPKLKQPATFSSWLYRISWNVATDHRRSAAQQRTKNSNLQIKHLATIEETKRPQNQQLMQIYYEDIVEKALLQLSFDHRSVLVLHDLEDIPQKEVAEILGVPVGTVKSRLFHARAAMRQYLEQQGVQL